MIRAGDPLVLEMVLRGFEREVVERNPHLLEYVKKISRTTGIPLFMAKLDDELKRASSFNIIYPVGDPVFTHVVSLANSGSSSSYSGKYYSIEPPPPPRELLELLDEAFAIEAGKHEPPEDPEARRELVERIVSKILTPVDRGPGFYRARGNRVEVSRHDFEGVRYYVLREKIGAGILEPFLRDPYIEDISCPGVGCVYLVHKIFGPMETNVCFRDERELNRFILRLSERVGRPVSRARPIADAVLPDGSRINIVYGEDVSLKGSNFTIRKFSKEPTSVVQLIRWGTMSAEIAAYLWMALMEQLNVWIAGETASGKTTTLNAIAAFIPPEHKIVSIEDTAEVNLPHENWVRELTRDTGSPESSVTMFDLLRAALRQRPNYVIVGEIRGREGNIAFQAMQSVAWNTPVAFKVGGRVRISWIGRLVDPYYGAGEEGVRRVSGLEVLTITGRSSRPQEIGARGYRVSFAPVSHVIRHRHRGRLYRIWFSGGGHVDVTENHSLITYTPVEGMRASSPLEISEGDWLLVPTGLPVNADGDVRPTDEILGYVCGLAASQGPGTSLSKQPGDGAFDGAQEILGPRLGEAVEPAPGGLRPLAGPGPGDLLACYEGDLPERLLGSRPALQGFLRAYRDVCENRSARRCHDLRPAVQWISWLLEGPPAIEGRDPPSGPGILRSLGKGVGIVEVEKIEETSYEGWVYDVSVPGEESFLGGSLPVLLHNTGHGVMSTFHAANLQRLVQRLTGVPIEIPPSYIDNLNIAVFQSAVYDKRGRLMRRVIEVDEIIGYDASRKGVAYLPVFTWDPGNDVHTYTGRGSSFVLEQKIALRRGVPRSRIKEIYDELALRARFLRLLAEKGIAGYWKVWSAIRATYRHNIEDLVRRLERGDTSFVG